MKATDTLDACMKAVDLADRIRREALDADQISMTYKEVRAILNSEELDLIARGIEAAVASRNRAEIMVVELLHVLASPDPHAELVRETLAENSNVFDRARSLVGMDIEIQSTDNE